MLSGKTSRETFNELFPPKRVFSLPSLQEDISKYLDANDPAAGAAASESAAAAIRVSVMCFSVARQVSLRSISFEIAVVVGRKKIGQKIED